HSTTIESSDGRESQKNQDKSKESKGRNLLGADRLKAILFRAGFSSIPSRQRYCCICNNYKGKIVDGRVVRMLRFPVDETKRKVWIQRCKNARLNFMFKNFDQTRLCSEHFSGKSGPTKLCSLPTLFPKPDGSEKIYKLSVSKELMTVMFFLHPTIVQCKDIWHIVPLALDNSGNMSITNNDDHDALDTTLNSTLYETSDNEETSMSAVATDSITAVSLKFHDYDGASHMPSKMTNKMEQIQPDMATESTQTDLQVEKKIDASTQISGMLSTHLGIQCNRPFLTFDDICKDNDRIMIYTGIPDGDTFCYLFNKREGGIAKTTHMDRPRSLRLIDEFFMVLMRLRLGLLFDDLEFRFNNSVSTCGDMFNKWIDYLDKSLSFLVIWPSREIIDNTMPESFKAKYPHCRVVIDCIEIRTETPSSLQLKSLLYTQSNCKYPDQRILEYVLDRPTKI
ncbi:hypothetical protein KUTeg_018663, partial [Tegillarca granosa]